ncbi:hypothetical protein AMECASPLE_009014 [Ameca splendens]|uniref:Uncharacterized protein n=1 Tax=Ameca splendens TaxID=208324 RepID=A0ABV0ZXA2_9TELE
MMRSVCWPRVLNGSWGDLCRQEAVTERYSFSRCLMTPALLTSILHSMTTASKPTFSARYNPIPTPSDNTCGSSFNKQQERNGYFRLPAAASHFPTYTNSTLNKSEGTGLN